MNQLESHVEGRAKRIRETITTLFPTIGVFAADAAIDPYASRIGPFHRN
jgi:hypothetical protein